MSTRTSAGATPNMAALRPSVAESSCAVAWPSRAPACCTVGSGSLSTASSPSSAAAGAPVSSSVSASLASAAFISSAETPCSMPVAMPLAMRARCIWLVAPMRSSSAFTSGVPRYAP